MDAAATRRASRLLGALGAISLAASLVALMQWSASGTAGALRAAGGLAAVALASMLATRVMRREQKGELAPGLWSCRECASVNESGVEFCLHCGAVPRVRHARTA